MTEILHTERLLLRELTEDDADAVLAFNSDPRVMRDTGEPLWTDPDETRRRLRESPDYRRYGYGRWAVVHKPERAVIGFCGLKFLEELGEVDLGYRLAHAYWGRGLATEASRAGRLSRQGTGRQTVARPRTAPPEPARAMSPMKKVPAAADPAAFVAALDGWRREIVLGLCQAVRAAAPFEEGIKWGNLVFFRNGPALLIRAEEERVLFAFLRGQRLAHIEPRLKGGGKYELATLELREGMGIPATRVRRLAREAAALNLELGDPTKASRKQPKSTAGKGKAATARTRAAGSGRSAKGRRM